MISRDRVIGVAVAAVTALGAAGCARDTIAVPEGFFGALAVEADPSSRTVAVDLDLDLGDGSADRVEGLLGAPVEADVALTPLTGVLVLRRAEITWRDGVALALVLERDGEVLRAAGRPLTLGRRSGDRVEVVGGLAPGEVLITAPLEALTPGSLVRTEEERAAPR